MNGEIAGERGRIESNVIAPAEIGGHQQVTTNQRWTTHPGRDIRLCHQDPPARAAAGRLTSVSRLSLSFSSEGRNLALYPGMGHAYMRHSVYDGPSSIARC